jgi:SAM-dependent methyltransferase
VTCSSTTCAQPPGPGRSAHGADVLKVGHGPGLLLGLLARRDDVGRIVGVDPSVEMRRLAVRRLAAEIATGRLELRRGDAAATGLPDASVDIVVSVNSVAIWPELERVENGLRSRFADVRRMRTRRCTVFDARVENTLP